MVTYGKKSFLPRKDGVNPSLKLRTVNLLGIGVNRVRMDQLLDICEEHIDSKKNLLLGVVNVAKVVKCHKNAELRKSLMEADILLADGLPIVWLSKLIGDPLPERIAGIDILYKLLEFASKRNYRVYFLGAKQEVVQRVVEIVRKDYPGIHVAGYRDGYFDESEEQSVAENIAGSQADVLFVAISSPKKEIFLKRWQSHLNVPICHGVGGSFDVLAGITKRAPLWMQKCGLEWLYRLIQEPRRMWKRYLVTNSIFIKLSLEAIVRAKFSRLFRSFGFSPTSKVKKAE